MALKWILYEKGCGKWIRFHDTPEPQFHSNRDKATRIYGGERGVSDELFMQTIVENKLQYLMKTIRIDVVICRDDGTEEYLFDQLREE